MTSLRGLWKDCVEWDRRYQQEVDRTNGRTPSTRLTRENRVGDRAASTADPPADTLSERGRHGGP